MDITRNILHHLGESCSLRDSLHNSQILRASARDIGLARGTRAVATAFSRFKISPRLRASARDTGSARGSRIVATTFSIDAAMKYVDTGRVGRDRAPRGPQSKHGENTLLTIAGRSGIAPYQ